MSDSTFFYIITALFILVVLLSTIAAYQFGYQRGNQFSVVEPSTPSIEEEEVPEAITFSVGYLDQTTGPIDIEAGIIHVNPAIVAFDAARIAELEREVEHQKILKLRYFHLLKAERSMMRQIIRGVGTTLTPYWRRWVRDQFSDESPFWSSQSWVRIANINHASD